MSRNPVVRFPSSSAGEAPTAAKRVDYKIRMVDPSYQGSGERRKFEAPSLGAFELG